MPKVSEEHAETRRRQVLDGARRAFARHGYEGATVARLEEEIGLSRGAIFNYFENKWALFYALAEEDYSRASEIWRRDGLGPLLRHVTTESPDWLGVYLELLRMLRNDPRLREQWSRRDPEGDAELGALLADMQSRGELRRDIGVEQIGLFVGLVIDGVVVHAATGFPVDVESVLQLVVSAIGPQ